MDTYRAFLAILISFLILIGYQYFFVGFKSEEPVVDAQKNQESVVGTEQNSLPQQAQQALPSLQSANSTAPPAMNQQDAEKITVDTDLYTAVISGAGGTVKSFVLKEHRETSDENSPGKQLVENSPQMGYPLRFSWGTVIPAETYYQLENKNVDFADGKGELRMY